ncbi:protein SCO1 homolog, mitochondrial [Daktulosphaira vitifoliae]|uniref:protein SCO1 homolog, mitochondrial n=1 Tax=Daktulosphaira vitifoliae TaxID=58002 RepID=UPI0021AA6EAD|nr:protein SCO1 homolog, mitochondrial [Daktulosphaira vitifoliae]
MLSNSFKRLFQNVHVNRIAKVNFCNVSKESGKPIQLPKRKGSLVGKRGPITWKNFAITGIIGTGLVSYLYYLKGEQEEKERRERKRQLGKAQIGGSFELVDGANNIIKSEQFLGKWMLIYFGFSHCPDICPDELEKMAIVIDKLDKEELSIGIQGIFITVDPERDSPQIVEKYIKEFSPKFIGLSGTSDQIQKVCKKYRVYYSPGKKDVDNDYIVDHTIIMYLVNPDGEFIDYFGQNKTAEEIVEHILMHMFKFEQDKGTLLSNALGKISSLTNKKNIF